MPHLSIINAITFKGVYILQYSLKSSLALLSSARNELPFSSRHHLSLCCLLSVIQYTVWPSTCDLPLLLSMLLLQILFLISISFGNFHRKTTPPSRPPAILPIAHRSEMKIVILYYKGHASNEKSLNEKIRFLLNRS